MKKLIFGVCLVVIGSAVRAQSDKIHFGAKAGLNYSDNGKIELRDVEENGRSLFTGESDRKTGFHIGGFVRVDLTDNLYLKPELQYTQTTSAYTLDEVGDLDYTVKKLDVPILLGVKILGPLSVFGGPTVQYILDNDLDQIDIGTVENEISAGLQFGTGIQLGRFYADIRYERGLGNNDTRPVTRRIGNVIERQVQLDSRPDQFILSVALDF